MDSHGHATHLATGAPKHSYATTAEVKILRRTLSRRNRIALATTYIAVYDGHMRADERVRTQRFDADSFEAMLIIILSAYSMDEMQAENGGRETVSHHTLLCTHPRHPNHTHDTARVQLYNDKGLTAKPPTPTPMLAGFQSRSTCL